MVVATSRPFRSFSRPSLPALASSGRMAVRRMRMSLRSLTKQGFEGFFRSRTPAVLAIAIMVPVALLLSRSDRQFTDREAYPVPAGRALEMLRQGNARFVDDRPIRSSGKVNLRAASEGHARNPLAIVVGCADLRCPVEAFFDARPGDMYVLRNVGNACNSPEDSLIASVEYAIGALGAKLLLVMGHSHCRAMARATKLLAAGGNACKACPTALDEYLEDLGPAVALARRELGSRGSFEELLELATKINVFNTMEKMLEYSVVLRAWVASGDVELHGAMLRITTGEVEFLGQHPRIRAIVNSTSLWPK